MTSWIESALFAGLIIKPAQVVLNLEGRQLVTEPARMFIE